MENIILRSVIFSKIDMDGRFVDKSDGMVALRVQHPFPTREAGSNPVSEAVLIIYLIIS